MPPPVLHHAPVTTFFSSSFAIYLHFLQKLAPWMPPGWMPRAVAPSAPPLHATDGMHIINAILNYIHVENQSKIEGRFSHGETLYRRRGDYIFRWGRLCSDTEYPGETSFQPRRDSISGETLFRDTGKEVKYYKISLSLKLKFL